MNWILTNEKLKRATDIVGAVFGLTIFSPLLIPICVLIRLDGANAIFFKQERLGKHGKRFMLYKFTTMQEDAHVKGPLLSKTDDPRITRVGKIVRMLSLNELAQFINVLKGEMSIVGPRPEVPEYAKYWPEELKQKILSLKPGITGYATVMYWQESNILNDKDDPEGFYINHILPQKLELETWYVDNWNLLWDVKLMVQTFMKAFSGERKGNG
jgi:lipopolysaccharide/colanic/teichoic acid biosynthesis glycosyltransferase